MTPSVAERPARLVIPALPASRRALTWADVISIWNGAPCHQVANSPPPPRRARRPEGDAWSCSWTPASELARLVLSGLWLGGGLRRGVGGRRLGGRGGGGAAVTGLEQLALPLRQWLLVGGAGRHRRGPLLGGGLGAVDRAEPQSLGDGIGDDAGEQAAGPDRVVVAGDRVVDLVGVAVGVEDGHHGDAELARLGHRDVLLAGVHHPDRRGRPGHVPDAAEVALELLALVAQPQDLLLGPASWCRRTAPCRPWRPCPAGTRTWTRSTPWSSGGR